MCEPRPDPEIRAQLCSVVQRARRHIWHGNHHFSRGEGLERTLETVKAVGNTKSTQKTNGKTLGKENTRNRKTLGTESSRQHKETHEKLGKTHTEG